MDKNWFNKTIEDTYKLLETDIDNGLTDEQVSNTREIRKRA